jgi:hypothetical protein
MATRAQPEGVPRGVTLYFVRDGRVPLLAATADVVAVLVFAAVGRADHGEAFDVLALLGTAAPFLAGVVAAWATPYVRADPASLRSGGLVLCATVVVGLVLRFLLLDRLPLSFVVVAAVALTVLIMGWRGLSMLVASRTTHRVR